MPVMTSTEIDAIVGAGRAMTRAGQHTTAAEFYTRLPGAGIGDFHWQMLSAGRGDWDEIRLRAGNANDSAIADRKDQSRTASKQPRRSKFTPFRERLDADMAELDLHKERNRARRLQQHWASVEALKPHEMPNERTINRWLGEKESH